MKRIKFNDERIIIDKDGRVRLRSRHPEPDRALGYICFICNSSDVYSNVNEDRIQCNTCGKKWNYSEFLRDCEFAIGEKLHE